MNSSPNLDAPHLDNLPRVSVIIPYYNAPTQLQQVLAAVAAQDYPGDVEVIIADDGSAPPASEDPQLRQVLQEVGAMTVWQADLGFRAAAARNLGARQATGNVLAFFDGDTCPEPGFLSATVNHVHRNPRALVVGSRLTGRDGQEPAWLREAWRYTDHLRAADDTSWRFIISAALVCSRSFFSSLSGFDATLVGYGGEDWEFAWRAWNAGATFIHEPGAIAIHPEDDFGKRFPDPAETTRRKNVETIALAARITHPICRPRFGIFESADIAVYLPAADAEHGEHQYVCTACDQPPSAAWHQPGVRETVIASWLAADVIVYVEGDVPALFAADPRVRAIGPRVRGAAGGVGGKEKESAGEKSLQSAGEHSARIEVCLAQPYTLDDEEAFYATVTDRRVRLPDATKIATARGTALRTPWQPKAPEDIGLRLVDEPQRLERTFGGW